jgi:hypothetical protein
MKSIIVALAIAGGVAGADASVLTVQVTAPQVSPPLSFKMGEPRRPDGALLTLDSQSLLLDGKRWMPVMGEFHYARCPENEWREELLKLKAGGIDTVATYVFWIHHEEIEGQFDWSGRRNLRQFIKLSGEVGLKAIVRCGAGHAEWKAAHG